MVQVWVTTADKSKLLSHEADISLTSVESQPVSIVVEPDKQYQEMVGFGASITDASAWLIQTKLPADRRSDLLQELFNPESGLGLSFTRLTIGASDFSRHHYSLDDMPAGLKNFALTRFSIEPNRFDVIPTVKEALSINPNLHVMASPWSAPGWMKTSDSLIKGSLLPEAYETFSEYLLRFVAAYTDEGIPIFALTLQNEPHFEPGDYPGMRLEAPARAKIIGDYLGPKLVARGFDTKILDWDHNWDEPNSPMEVLNSATARPYLSGVAWHCYAGNVTAQAVVHQADPELDAYMTECSGGEWAPLNNDALLWVTRNLIIGSTRNWASGVLLWNLALDENHGPHLGGCTNCRGVVTINSVSGTITRNAEYYALAHASRFVHSGAKRIESSTLESLDTVAFFNPADESIVLIAANPGGNSQNFQVINKDKAFRYSLPARSVGTFIWKIQ